MNSKVLTICVVLCILLNACASRPIPTPQPIAETYTPTAIKASPTSIKLTATVTTRPPTPIPTVIQSAEASSPVFVYLGENTLLLQVGTLQPKPVGVLEDLGEIRNALMVDDTIFLIRDFGLQRLNLKDGSSKILLRFEDSIMSGQLILDAGHSQLFYGAITYYTSVSMIGYYDLKKETLNPVFSYSDSLITLRIMGITEDGQGLYCLALGDDPGIGATFIVDINQGIISKQFEFRGWAYTSMAPNSQLLATPLKIFDSSDNPPKNTINVYDFSSLPLAPPNVFQLPNPAFEIFGNGFFWSPDGKRIYFALVEIKHDPYVFISRGLWVLDVESGSIEMITNTPDQPLHTISISPDGKLILLRPETNGDAYLVNTQTGEIRSFSVPVLASFVGWK